MAALSRFSSGIKRSFPEFSSEPAHQITLVNKHAFFFPVQELVYATQINSIHLDVAHERTQTFKQKQKKIKKKLGGKKRADVMKSDFFKNQIKVGEKRGCWKQG